MRITQEAACDFLQAHDSYFILCHAYPDGDTLGSAAALCLGLRQLGKQAVMSCADPIPAKFRFLTDGLCCPTCPADAVPVAVDVADDSLLGAFAPRFGKRIALCIDHHPSNIDYAARTFVDSAGASNCENIYRILLALGVTLTADMAAALYVGISTDTGCFKYANTTGETHRIAAALMETGIDIGEINRIMFDTKTKARYALELDVLSGLVYAAGDRIAMMTVTRAMQAETGCDDLDMDGISSLPRTIEGVVIGITLREKAPGLYKVSLRTHAPIDASAMCKQFGGGGHARAAGCELTGPLEEVQARLLAAAEEALCKG